MSIDYPTRATHAAVATLGGQPQVVTLTLERLLAAGIPLDALFIVHLALENPRYRKAHRHLEAALAEHYPTLHYHPVIVRRWARPIADLDSAEALEAARDTFDTLFLDLKRHGYIVHLCVSGGRRLLGTLGILAAQHHFSFADKVWHLYSSDTVRARTHDGALLHLPCCDESRLLPVPFQPLSWMAGSRPAMDDAQIAEDADRCQQVLTRLRPAARRVLRAIVAGDSASEISRKLTITPQTVYDYKRQIVEECITVWGQLAQPSLSYDWLRRTFTPVAHLLEV